MQRHNVTLELSAKPFMDDSEESMRQVFRKLFCQWRPLTRKAEMISVLFWTADGSEILEFSGDLEQKFEWGYWRGIANPLPKPEHPKRFQLLSGNWYPVKYRPDAAPRTYAWLKRMIEICRETGMEITGKRIRIGATFDNGPEFSVSDFKYNRHREIAQGHSIYPHSFVTCDSVLHADHTRYAAYPDGIPEGLTLGTFLGAQYRELAKAVGFDYIWLSNGMGFGIETWGISGALFDKRSFYPEKKKEAAERMLKFWKDFLEAAPGTIIETRGSNYSAGIEMATDAAPIQWLYRNHIIAPPVNSPMAAILKNPGNSMAAYLSHIAELPGRHFTFRYYIHDPWFQNSPWLDRYARQPWDLYMPLSASRINEKGEVETPDSLSFLSCDDSAGEMPDQVPEEVIPHLLEADRTHPDEPGAFLQVYPFDEYAATDRLDSVFSEEMFFADALQNGAPVNSVISTRIFLENLRQGNDPMKISIPLVPVSALENPELLASFSKLAEIRPVICYGAIQYSSDPVIHFLGLKREKPLSGDARITELPDTAKNGAYSSLCHVLPLFDGGGLCEIADSAKLCASAEICGETRALVTKRDLTDRGCVIFVRSVLSGRKEQLPPNATNFQKRNFLQAPPSELFPAGRLLRLAMKETGWEFIFCETEPDKVPVMTLSRSDGAFLLNGYVPNTTVSADFRTPFGIPLPFDREIRIENGHGCFHFERNLRMSCRAFIQQDETSTVSCCTSFQDTPVMTDRMEIFGLRNADIRIFPPLKCKSGDLEIRTSPGDSARWSDTFLEPEFEETSYGRCMIFRNISGSMNIAWRNPKKTLKKQ